MKIGNLSERTGISERSLRHYESLGLLSPSRGVQGYREYSELDAERVAGIRSLMDASISLASIRNLMECVDGRIVQPCSRVLDAYRKSLAQVTAAIGNLTKTQKLLMRSLSSVEQRASLPKSALQSEREDGLGERNTVGNPI